MFQKIWRKFRVTRPAPPVRAAIQARRLEPRIMFSAVPGAEWLAGADFLDSPSIDPGIADGDHSFPSLEDPERMSLATGLPESDATEDGEPAHAISSRSPDQQLDELLIAFEADSVVRELVVIDRSVADYQRLVSDLESQGQLGLEVLLIEPDEDGWQLLSQELAQHANLDAIHIVSHGTAGQVQLGSTLLSSENLAAYAGTIAGWQFALDSEGDVLFYGCELSATEAGRDFLAELAALCQRDVAASNDLTGSSALGGDWELEYVIGSVATDVVFSAAIHDWQHVLETMELVATKDTYIDANEANENHGSSTTLIVDSQGPDLGSRRLLLEFDLSLIPSGATIHSAILSLEATSISGDLDVGIFRILEAWEEGAADGGIDAASWFQRTDTATWSTPGGLVDSLLMTATTRSTTGEHGWDITSWVNDWVAGVEVNHGIMIASPDGDSQWVEYASSESGNGPRLLVDYKPVNVSPVAVDDGVLVRDESSSFLIDPLSNDSDSDGDDLTISAINGVNLTPGGRELRVTGGTVALQGDGVTLLFTPDRNYFGSADFVYTASDGQGGLDSAQVSLEIVDTTAPGTPQVTLIEDINNDGFINLAEHSGGIDYTVALPLDARAGEVLEMNGESRVLSADDIAAGVVFGQLAPPASGDRVDVSAFLRDPAGNVSPIATDFAVVDLQAPAAPVPLNLSNLSDTGESDQDNYTGDSRPVFELPAGTGTPGDIVTIYSNGEVAGTGMVESDGSVVISIVIDSFTVKKFTYTFTDQAGNEGDQSLGLFVEFFDPFLPYHPPTNPELLGVEQKDESNERTFVNLLVLQPGDSESDEGRVRIPYQGQLNQQNLLELVQGIRQVSTNDGEVDAIEINVETTVYFEKLEEGAGLTQFLGDLNYRVATLELDPLESYEQQLSEFWNRLNDLAEEEREEYAESYLLAGNASLGTGVVVAGFAFWGLHALLIAGWFATSIPVFCRFDPLMLLLRGDRDRETLVQIAKGNSERK